MRVGLVGTGHWAVTTHGAGLVNHPDATFAGVWGRDPVKAERVAATFGVPAFATFDDLLGAVDAVSIAVVPPVQAELAVRAATAGRHLLLDKPLALRESDAEQVVAAVRATGVASIVFFTNRFYSNVDEFLTGAGQVWDGARVTMFASIFRPGSPYAGSTWRREWGALWDIGPHALSLVLPLLGPVEDVCALAGPHDTTYGLLRHRGGAVTALALTLAAPPDATVHEVVLYGADGAVSVPRGDGTAVAAYRTAVTQLAANVAAGVASHPCDVRFGRDVVTVLQRLQQARR